LARKKKLPILADDIYEGMTYGKQKKSFAELSTEEVTIFKCSGLTKGWFVPGWRGGWIIIYAKQDNYQCYYPFLRNIFNIILMPHTVIQASIKEILENKKNDEYVIGKMQKLAKNQKLL
jgi:tyrosine aminotransferase